MSEPAANPAATSFPAPILSLPLGLEVLRTYSGVLVCLEIVSVVHVRSFTECCILTCVLDLCGFARTLH